MLIAHREHLSSRQATLFKQTAEANRTLEDRVTELEKELGVWKLAYDSAQTDSVNLKAQVGRLQRNIGSWKVSLATGCVSCGFV